MAESGLPEHVQRLIENAVPTLEALEIVLLVARDPGREWASRSIPPLLQPGLASEASIQEYLKVLVDHGLGTWHEDRFVYAPRTPELVHAIEGLIVAYHQRPVTLIRTIYAAADLKNIRSFADAFRLRKGS